MKIQHIWNLQATYSVMVCVGSQFYSTILLLDLDFGENAGYCTRISHICTLQLSIVHLHSSTLRDVLLWANFVRNDLPTNHTSSNFARVTAVNGYSSEIPNHQGIFYVRPEITHGSSLGSVSCRFTSISDRTGTHVGTCMHTRLHVEIAPVLIPAQLDRQTQTVTSHYETFYMITPLVSLPLFPCET